MDRFRDQPLGERPHLAVLSSSKVGNFVVTTPLLRGLEEKYPGCVLDFFGSEMTREFEEGVPYIDFRFSLHGAERSSEEGLAEGLEEVVSARIAAAGPYALAVNCDGFDEVNVRTVPLLRPRYVVGASLEREGKGRLPAGDEAVHRMLEDPDWNSPDFLARYSEVLESNYIGEIFCRMAYVETDFHRLELPSRAPDFPVPDVLLHVTATRRAKMWPREHWRAVVEWLDRKGFSQGLVGRPPKVQREAYHAGGMEEELLEGSGLRDLRGRTGLLELAGALKRARACVTVDAGPMHVAAAVGCPTVAVMGNDPDGIGASPLHLWAPRASHVRVPRTRFTCTVCREHRFRNEGCLVEGHPCMSHLDPERILDELSRILTSTSSSEGDSP